MNKPESPVKAVKPPVTPEVLAEVLRRTEEPLLDEQRKAARPAKDFMAEQFAKHSAPD